MLGVKPTLSRIVRRSAVTYVGQRLFKVAHYP